MKRGCKINRELMTVLVLVVITTTVLLSLWLTCEGMKSKKEALILQLMNEQDRKREIEKKLSLLIAQSNQVMSREHDEEEELTSLVEAIKNFDHISPEEAREAGLTRTHVGMIIGKWAREMAHELSATDNYNERRRMVEAKREELLGIEASYEAQTGGEKIGLFESALLYADYLKKIFR